MSTDSIDGGRPKRSRATEAVFDWGPGFEPSVAVGLTLAMFVSIEAIVLLTHSLSVRRLGVTLLVVVGATVATHTLLVRRFGVRPRSGTGLGVIAVALQCGVILGYLFAVTWWVPLVPALLLAWAPLGLRDRSWTRPRRMAVVSAVVAIVGVGPTFSLASTLVRPSTDPMTLRTVEWLRLHGGEGVVNGVEHWWYARHAPRTGGAPDVALSLPGVSADTPTTGSIAAAPTVPVRGTPTTKPGVSPPPTNPVATSASDLVPVRALVTDPLPGEGVWSVVSGSAARPAIAVTRLRPDAIHTSVVVALARMDPTLVRLRLVAGLEDPGGSWPEHGQVPISERSSLLAVFNSGFRQREAGGGFWVAGRQGAPLVDGAASFVIRKDGTATIAQWGRDASLESSVAAVRQNLALIVDKGVPVAGLDQDSNRRWGRTVGGRVFVWRSGIGVTQSGALIYAGGPGMSIQTLADVLTAAGTVRAMELDINSAWVAYFLYEQTASGAHGTRLLPGMRHPPTRYLSPQSRDFFMVNSR